MVKLIDYKGVPASQLCRISPCTQGISDKTRNSIDSLVNRYIKFLDKARINSEVTFEIVKLAEKKGFFKDKNNFKIENRDGTAFALVKAGKKSVNEGLRIIYTHTDAPCLQIKPAPIRFEWGHDEQPLHLGVELSIIPYGGAVPYHWFARVCEVRGWIIKQGKRREIKFEAYISDFSAHVDNRAKDGTEFSDAFPWEKIKLITGHDSEKKLLEWLRFDSRIDFARSKLYVVPKVETEKLSAGDYIAGYAHDDRSCTYAAIEALLAADPVYTSIVIGFDKEEVGSPGDGGAKGNFFERVLRETIARSLGVELEQIPSGLEQKIIQNSYALSGDADISPSQMEAKEENGIDLRSITKLGYGASISAHDGAFEANQVSAAYIDKLLCLMDKRKIRYQVVGTFNDADNFEGQGSHAKYFTNRGIPAVELGLGVNSAHAQVELIHAGDLYWLKQAYKAFLEDKEK